MTIEERDEIVLKHAGLMGHPVIGIVTAPDGSRRTAMEANEVIEVTSHTGDKTLSVYQRDEGDKKYRLVLARTEDGLTLSFPPVPDATMPAYAEGILAAIERLGFDWTADGTSPSDEHGESTFTLYGVCRVRGAGIT